MAKITIENEPKKHIRPSTKDSDMFVAFDGRFYSGHYLKTNTHSGKVINGIIKNRTMNQELIQAIKAEQQKIKDAVAAIDFAQSKINQLLTTYKFNHGK